MQHKVLIANRGEIACRIIKTLKKLNLKTVAIYSDFDSNALHVQLADEAYLVGEAPSGKSYLNINKIVEIAKQSSCTMVHPGYGFLSENAEFVTALVKNNIIFIGPSSDSIKAMGDKKAAKEHVEKLKLPVIPGYHGDETKPDKLQKEADKIGYPLLIKASAGGGGKGMRIVNSKKDFKDALAACQREAKASFGSDTVILEKYLVNPRHIEIQVTCDNHGNAVYLFERDCSYQRRHQKVIEEAPAYNFDNSLRIKMGETAIKIAKSINYSGVGTLEFLVDNNDYYFLEMNTRLQVEHPVTEFITREDLVTWQLDIALDKKLPKTQAELQISGHAIEARIYAEDPANEFLPTTGVIEKIIYPALCDDVRLDHAFIDNMEVSVHYDPMLAKLICYGKTRELATQRLVTALSDLHLIGIKNNIKFLTAILTSQDFIKQAPPIATNYIEKNSTKLIVDDVDVAGFIIAAAILEISTYSSIAGFRLNCNKIFNFKFKAKNTDYNCKLEISSHNTTLVINDASYAVQSQIFNDNIKITFNNKSASFYFRKTKHGWYLDHTDMSLYVKQVTFDSNFSTLTDSGSLTAPMPGLISKILVNEGDKVPANKPLLIMEAMKMEHTIHSNDSGIINKINFAEGDLVEEGSVLLNLEEERNAATK